MESTMQSRRSGWCCAPVLVAVIIAVTLLRGCSGGTPVPVVVSTVYRSVANVFDVAANGAGTLLLLTYNGAVYRGLPNGTTVQVVATINSGGQYYYGITCDVAANVAFVTGWNPNRVYKLALSAAEPFAGSGAAGSADGVGAAAQLNGPYGIIHYAPTGLLYVADFLSGAIRKIVVATANVTTVATVGTRCNYLCITANGALLYATTSSTIVRVRTSLINSVTTLAGDSTTLFYDSFGIALNSDESVLIIAGNNNFGIRRLELSTNSVTTIAGSSTRGGVDGPGLSATFSYPYGARWYCNQSSMLCGVLVADWGNAVRFVAIEGPTHTVTVSHSSPTSATGTLSFSTCSATASASASQATASQTSPRSVTPSTSVELTDSQRSATHTAASSRTLASSNSLSLTHSQATASQYVSRTVSASLAVSPPTSDLLTQSQRSFTQTFSSSPTPSLSSSCSLTVSTTSTTDRSQSRTLSRTSTHNSRTSSASPTGTTSLSAVTLTRSPFSPSLVPTDTLKSPSADVTVTNSNTSTLGNCTDAIHVVLSPPLSMFLNNSVGTDVRSSVGTLDELCVTLSTPIATSPLPCVYLEPTMDPTTNTSLRWSAAAPSLSSSPVRLVLAYNVGASWRVAPMSSNTTTTSADDAGSVTITPADTVPWTPGSMGFVSVVVSTSPTYGEQRTLWFEAGCAAEVVNISVVVTWPTRTVNKATEAATMAASSAAAALGGDVVSAASLRRLRALRHLALAAPLVRG